MNLAISLNEGNFWENSGKCWLDLLPNNCLTSGSTNFSRQTLLKTLSDRVVFTLSKMFEQFSIWWTKGLKSYQSRFYQLVKRIVDCFTYLVPMLLFISNAFRYSSLSYKRNIKDLVKHLKWSFFANVVNGWTSLPVSAKSYISDVG